MLAVTANASHPQDPLFRAIQQDDAECVMGLLEKGSPSLLEETEKRLRMTPLTWAVLCESEPMTSLLLERGANPMAVSRSGENPLTLASMLGRLDLLKLLDLDSSLAARKELAEELNVHAGEHGSAEQNIALSKAVWQKLAENGGQVPASLRD